MGQHGSKTYSINEADYFKKVRTQHLDHFSRVNGFLENTSEWIYLLKQELKKNTNCRWSKNLLKKIKGIENFKDLSSKMAFAWNKIDISPNVSRIESINVCKWKESIANLQTFSYEIEIDPCKKSLHKFLTTQTDCTLHTLISMFKKCLLDVYTKSNGRKILLKPKYLTNIAKTSIEIDTSILNFCLIMEKIIPKFFLDIPEMFQDMQSIIRDSIISGDVLKLLILTRKELEKEKQNEYIRGLKIIEDLKTESPVLEQLEKDNNSNYKKAIKSLGDITQSNSIGQMHDAIAMLMNHISLSLYNPENPDALAEDDTIISAFLFVLARSSTPDLPLYLSILESFMDKTTLTIKDVGKGVVKLSFLLNNIPEWGTFIQV